MLTLRAGITTAGRQLTPTPHEEGQTEAAVGRSWIRPLAREQSTYVRCNSRRGALQIFNTPPVIRFYAFEIMTIVQAREREDARRPVAWSGV